MIGWVCIGIVMGTIVLHELLEHPDARPWRWTWRRKRARIKDLEAKLRYQVALNESLMVVAAKEKAELEKSLKMCRDDRIRLSTDLSNLRARIHREADK